MEIPVKLETMKSVPAALRKKLNAAGVHTVQDLALVDVERAQVDGLTHEQMRDLKRQAQRHIFQSTVERIEHAAEDAIDAIKAKTGEATKAARLSAEQALDAIRVKTHEATEAAKLAGERALQAAQEGVQTLAKEAATEGRKIATVAKRGAAKAGQKAVLKTKRVTKKAVRVTKQRAKRLQREAKTGAKLVVKRAGTEAQKIKVKVTGRNGHVTKRSSRAKAEA